MGDSFHRLPRPLGMGGVRFYQPEPSPAGALGDDARRSAECGSTRPTLLGNALLDSLEGGDRELIAPFLTRVVLRPRQLLHHPGTPLESIYFPVTCLISVSGKAGSTQWVEVWLIGSEGMSGIPAILGTDRSPAFRRMVQVGGEALRLSTCEFTQALGASPSLRAAMLRYVDSVLLQTAQANICNSTHGLKERLARWLLVARNALRRDEIALTHQLLARLLGVRRPSVTQCLGLLQEQGAIMLARGAHPDRLSGPPREAVLRLPSRDAGRGSSALRITVIERTNFPRS